MLITTSKEPTVNNSNNNNDHTKDNVCVFIPQPLREGSSSTILTTVGRSGQSQTAALN